MLYLNRTCLTRVVCQNTLSAALSEKGRASFRVKHTVNASNRLESAHNALATVSADVKTVEQKLNFLAQRKMTREGMVSILDKLFPKREKTEDGAAVNQTRRENILGDILRLYESNDRNAFPEQRGTSYNLLNAITNYTDHERSTQLNGRAESAMFGSGDRLKSQALEVIMQTSAGLPTFTTAYQDAPRKPITSAPSILDDILAASR